MLAIIQVPIYAQSIDTPYGKNRVQYHDDFKYWSKYETQNFIVYWYGKGKEIGQVAAQMAELDHNEIRKTIEHKISDKIEILVYVDVNDLKQSNIGAEEAFVNTSGQTKITGTKMFVYFDGNHHHLRQQIREGIASVYLSAIMFGANFQEIIQNAILLEVPDWYAEGIVSFAASNWNIFSDDELRDVLYRNDKWSDFEKLMNDHPRIAGHVLWYYIQRNYGKSAIANILYLTRISRDIENAIELVVNTPFDQVIQDCEAFVNNRYEAEKGVFDLPRKNKMLPLKNKKYIPISAIDISPNGEYIAYATNQIGKTKVYLQDIKTQKSKRITTRGYKNSFQATDYEYPHFTWSPDSRYLYYTYQHNDLNYLVRYEVESGMEEVQLLPEVIQRVYSIDYYDSRYMVFAAATNGMSDLYIYDTKNRDIINITDDLYDDLDAQVGEYNGEKGIYFASNRLYDHILPSKLDTIIPIDNFDIFFYPLAEYVDAFRLAEMPKTLERITDTPDQNERKPLLAQDHILVLNDAKGIINTQYVSLYDQSSHYVNNYGRNIIMHDYNADNGKYLSMLYFDGKYSVYQSDAKDTINPYLTQLAGYGKSATTSSSKVVPLSPKRDTFSPGMMFQSPFPDPPNLRPIQEAPAIDLLPFLSYQSLPIDVQREAQIIKINSNRIQAAGLRFKLADFTSRMDNSVLFEGLELYEGASQRVNQLPMGILFRAEVNDLFEDYTFEGGARFPTTFNGSEYFMFFENNKKLIDKRFGFYRRALTERSVDNVGQFVRPKKEIMIGMYQWKYPFSIYSSVRALASLRFDRNYYKATSDATLSLPIKRDKRLGLRLEYVFDNSLDYATNVKHGSRAKVFVEGYNQFELDVIDGLDFDLNKGFTGVVGFDARHYVPLLRHSVLAFRATGAKSFGTQQNVYLLGDVNNTIIPSFDDAVPVPVDRQFAFKTNVNHLRGFRSNIRNGSTYLLSNAELRLSLFRYFLPKTKGPTILRDFQIVGFADAGMAWYGISPYADGNPINTIYIDGPIAQLEVRYYRDPMVIGYGTGIRTTLLGYYIRIDRAWGVETRERQDPIWHISVGYDF